MRWVVVTLVTGIAVLAAEQASAQCGGICLYENGSPDLARGAAGAGARAQDASTVFWNPAGMTELERNEILLGLGVTFAELNPELNGGTVTPSPPPRGGGNASGFAPFLGGFFSTELPYGIRFGLASSILYGGAVDYNASWTGRGYVTDASLLSLMLQPTFAYAVTDWLSLGAAPVILYTTFSERLKVTGLPGEPTVKIDKADGWSAGGAFSALVKPFEGTRIGLYYRTEIHADTNGSVQGPAGVAPNVNTDFTFPQGVNVSLYQKLGDRFALLADAGWTDWSAFSNIPLQIGAIGATQRRGWNDTWRIGAGVQFTPSDKWTLQTGFGYDSSPIESKRLLPDFPVQEQYRFSAGFQLRPKDYLEISFGYQFLWFGDLELHHVALPPTNQVVLNGKYDPAWAQQASVSLRVKF